MTIRQRAAVPKSSDMVVSKDMYNGDKPRPSPKINTQHDDELTWKSLLPAVAVSILVSIAAYYACGHTIEMMEDVLVATIRTVVQLTLLASLLSPLFKLVDGQTKVKSTKYNTAPLLVLGYVFLFMLPLAAWEASSKSKLTLHPMSINNSLLLNNNIVLVVVMVSLLTAVSLMGAVALFVIVKPKPWYSPRHVIPLCGMLFNNALSAISVCLDILFSELQSKQRDTIELMISFGSDAWSATRPILRSVLSSSLTPQINSMNVIGLIAIPGMMTGNLLAGSSPHKAAKYQMMIMILILGGNFISTAMTTELLLWNVFEEKGALRDDWIENNDSLRVSQLISSMMMVPWKSPSSIGGTKQDSESILDSSVIDVKLTSDRELTESDNPFFSLSLREASFANNRRKMTADFTVPNSGDIAILEGVSGVGKSTLLKSIAMLNSGMRPSASAGSMKVSLQGKDRDSYLPQEWRKQVLYVPQQISSTLQGTPKLFIQFIAPFHPQFTLEALTLQTARYLTTFDCANILEQSWSELSGGESQRALLSIALALKPKILLADESTSALPNDMKLKVELELKRSATTIIMISHDREQISRLGTVRLRLAAV